MRIRDSIISSTVHCHSRSQGDQNDDQSDPLASRDPEQKFSVMKTSQGWYDIRSFFQCSYKTYAKVGPLYLYVCAYMCMYAHTYKYMFEIM